VISSEDCGFVVENGSGASLVEAITVLRNEPLLAYAMGLRGRRALEHGYAMRELCGEWRRLLQSVGWQGQAD
jgi:hypothetical protein